MDPWKRMRENAVKEGRERDAKRMRARSLVADTAASIVKAPVSSVRKISALTSRTVIKETASTSSSATLVDSLSSRSSPSHHRRRRCRRRQRTSPIASRFSRSRSPRSRHRRSRHVRDDDKRSHHHSRRSRRSQSPRPYDKSSRPISSSSSSSASASSKSRSLRASTVSPAKPKLAPKPAWLEDVINERLKQKMKEDAEVAAKSVENVSNIEAGNSMNLASTTGSKTMMVEDELEEGEVRDDDDDDDDDVRDVHMYSENIGPIALKASASVDDSMQSMKKKTVENSPNEMIDECLKSEMLSISQQSSLSPKHAELESDQHSYNSDLMSDSYDDDDDDDDDDNNLKVLHADEGDDECDASDKIARATSVSPVCVPRQPAYWSTVRSVATRGSRSVDEFTRVRTISEGAYGVVHEAIDKLSGDTVALKKIKMEGSGGAGFPVTSVREINLLMRLRHVNIVALREMVVGRRKNATFMVMDYIPHELKSLIQAKKQPFSASEVKCLMVQLLRGVAHMHENFILHRDLKTSNLLLDAKGVLKIADLGLARRFGEPLIPYTPLVVTLWYRSPELLLGAKTYSTSVDTWSVGCIFTELLTMKPLFEGAKGELDQLQRIFSLLGTPTEERWPGFNDLPHAKTWAFKPQAHERLGELLPRRSVTSASYLSDLGLDLLRSFLAYDPAQRISAKEALKHPWFAETPKPQQPIMISMSFPKSHKTKHHKR